MKSLIITWYTKDMGVAVDKDGARMSIYVTRSLVRKTFVVRVHHLNEGTQASHESRILEDAIDAAVAKAKTPKVKLTGRALKQDALRRSKEKLYTRRVRNGGGRKRKDKYD